MKNNFCIGIFNKEKFRLVFGELKTLKEAQKEKKLWKNAKIFTKEERDEYIEDIKYQF